MCWWPLLRKLFGLKAFQYNSNRGQRGANQNNKNKDSNGYDTSSGSQSRPSFTFPRSWRPPCRRGIKDAPPVPQSDGRRSSTDPINRSQTYNTELIDDMQQVEAVPLEDWNKNDNISMRHSLNKAPSKQEDIADDYMHSETEYDSHYDSHLDRKRHTRSPCWYGLLSRRLHLYIPGATALSWLGSIFFLSWWFEDYSFLCIPDGAYNVLRFVGVFSNFGASDSYQVSELN
jgi:hypothetical protein